MRDLSIGLILAATAAVAFVLERWLQEPGDCRRCLGVGRLQRWHRLTWKTCPRCGGTGTRRRTR